METYYSIPEIGLDIQFYLCTRCNYQICPECVRNWEKPIECEEDGAVYNTFTCPGCRLLFTNEQLLPPLGDRDNPIVIDDDENDIPDVDDIDFLDWLLHRHN